MKPEPLRGKKEKILQDIADREHPITEQVIYTEGRKHGVEDCCDAFTSAIEFWYIYRDEPLRFMDDFREDFKEYIREEYGYNEVEIESMYDNDDMSKFELANEEDLPNFNRWLFKYTFKDMIV